MTAARHHGPRVQREQRVPVLGVAFAEGPDGHVGGNTGVVDEDVDRAEVGEGRTDRVVVGDVERRRLCRQAVVGELRRSIGCPFGIEVVDHDGGAVLTQGPGDAEPDAPTGAGHQCLSLREVETHGRRRYSGSSPRRAGGDQVVPKKPTEMVWLPDSSSARTSSS